MHDYLYDPISQTACGRLGLGAQTQPAVALALHSSLLRHVHNRAGRMQSAACLT